MINSLSILIPCFNSSCTNLVESLQKQADELYCNSQLKFDYEIIVADDGSSDTLIVEKNKIINTIPFSRYIIREKNCGRAAIRNFLAHTAKNEWLLFIDTGMVIRNPHFLSNYVMGEKNQVTYGGYVIKEENQTLRGNLRYRYEKKYGGNSNAHIREKNPFKNFQTSNFLVRRDIMLKYPLDERFKRYGYEDVIWGKTLKLNNIQISHKDNPVSFEEFETNERFLNKTEEAMRTLIQFEEELRGYSTIIDLAESLNKYHLLPIVRTFLSAISPIIKKNLRGNKPSIFLFNIYKLGIFCKLQGKP